MKKSSLFGVGILAAVLMVGGCATGRNYQTDIDALNAKVQTLQGELASKDQAIARLEGDLASQRAALSQSENEKRLLAEKLDQTKSMAGKEAESDLK